MKEKYAKPRSEVIAIDTEQSMLTVSTGVLVLVTEGVTSSGIEQLAGGWDSTEAY